MPGSVWPFLGKRKTLVPARNRIPDRQADSIVTTPTELLKVNGHSIILKLFIAYVYLKVCDLCTIKLQSQTLESPIASGMSDTSCGSQDMPLAAIGVVWKSF